MSNSLGSPLIPYDYQNGAIQSIFDYFKNGGKGNPLVVAPTGSGKSLMIAEFTKIVLDNWPKQKILILSHDMEILSQDFKAVQRQNPDKNIGLYSAGLRSRTVKSITIAGIQSVYNKPELFQDFNLIILDEAHTVSFDKKSRYQIFFKAVRKTTIGFTATPFRLGTGYLHLGKDAFFDDIVYEIPIEQLQNMEPPRLCKVTSKQPGITLDASEIKKQAGDFIIKELSMAFDREGITSDIVKELVKYQQLRKMWLVYAIDIEHCDHIAETLNEYGIKATAVHSKTGLERGPIIEKFENGEYQALVSVAMLTTGVDIPEVDLIILMRPTASPVLHVQIIGRGLRVAPDKKDLLVLDFAGNLKRNGPIDAPAIRVAGKGNGDPIMKACDNCQELVHIAVRICPVCQAEFIFKHNLSLNASHAEVMSLVSWHEVKDVEYSVFYNRNGIAMFQIMHFCGIRKFKKLVPIEHPGKARYFAKHWWERRSDFPFPDTAEEAFQLSHTLMKPKEILVDESSKYNEITDNRF